MMASSPWLHRVATSSEIECRGDGWYESTACGIALSGRCTTAAREVLPCAAESLVRSATRAHLPQLSITGDANVIAVCALGARKTGPVTSTCGLARKLDAVSFAVPFALAVGSPACRPRLRLCAGSRSCFTCMCSVHPVLFFSQKNRDMFYFVTSASSSSSPSKKLTKPRRLGLHENQTAPLAIPASSPGPKRLIFTSHNFRKSGNYFLRSNLINTKICFF